jgi:tyrosine-protein kinase Etk/Wzc
MNVNKDNKTNHSSISTQEPTFQEYLTIFIRGKWIIIITFIVSLAGVILYTKLTDPLFKASSTIIINTRFAESPLFLNVVMGTERNLVMNELEILKSRPLAELVAQKLLVQKIIDSTSRKNIQVILPPKEQQGKQKYASLEHVIQRLMLSVDLEALPGTDVIQITASSKDPEEAALIANYYGQSAYEMNLYTSRAKSRMFREFLEKELMTRKQALTDAEDSLSKFMQSHGIISLDQETSSLVSQASNLEAQRSETDISLQSMTKTLESYIEQFSQQETNVAKVIGEANDPYISRLQEQLAALEVQRDVTIAQNPASIGKDVYNQKLKEIDSQIANLRSKLKERTNEFLQSLLPGGQSGSDQRDPAGYLKQIKQKILETQIDIQTLKAKRKALDDALQQFEGRFANLPLRAVDYTRLQRSKLTNEQLYNTVQERFNEATINEQSQFGYIEFIDRAKIPDSPAKPKLLLNILLGIVFGIGLGVVIVLIKEKIELRIRNAGDLKRDGFSVLGTIMSMDEELKLLKKKSLDEQEKPSFDPRLITITSPFSASAESYRHLRTNLMYKRDESVLKSILITSSKPQEGKTTVCANLSVAFAQMQKNTVVIDADLRRPNLHNFFTMSKEPGLSDYLSGEMEIEQIINKTKVENLDFIGSGNIFDNPSELLASGRMLGFLDRMKKQYDIVILDSSPVLADTDPLIISTLVDTVVVITMAEFTRLGELRQSMELLGGVRGKVPGLIVNNFNFHWSHGIAYGYSGYGYYSSK